MKSLRRANPGINDRKVKTMISLRIGISSKIAIFAKKVIMGITIKNFLIIGVNSMSLCLEYQPYSLIECSYTLGELVIN